jgi:hypothetical protein
MTSTSVSSRWALQLPQEGQPAQASEGMVRTQAVPGPVWVTIPFSVAIFKNQSLFKNEAFGLIFKSY